MCDPLKNETPKEKMGVFCAVNTVLQLFLSSFGHNLLQKLFTNTVSYPSHTDKNRLIRVQEISIAVFIFYLYLTYNAYRNAQTITRDANPDTRLLIDESETEENAPNNSKVVLCCCILATISSIIAVEHFQDTTDNLHTLLPMTFIALSAMLLFALLYKLQASPSPDGPEEFNR